MSNRNPILEMSTIVVLTFLAVTSPVPDGVTPAVAAGTLVRIKGQSPPYFDSLQSACSNAREGDEVQAQAVSFAEHLVLDTPLTLHGGFDPWFGVDSGLTVVRGDMVVSTGAVVAKNIAIAPDMAAPTTVYAIELGGNPPFSVSTFDTAAANSLTLLGAATIPFYTYALGFNASGTVLYAMDMINRLGTIDTATGAYTLLGTVSGILVNHNVMGLAADPTTGTLYLVSANGFTGSTALYRLDPAVLSATLVGTQSSVKNLVELASDQFGTLYTMSIDTDSLYTFDKLTGQVTLIGALGQDIIGQQGLAFDPSAGVLYGIIGNRDLANYAFGTINRTTGAFTAGVATGGVRKMAIAPVR